MGRTNVKEPTADSVELSLDQIARFASKCVGQDYRQRLGPKELRLLTAVYVKRLSDMLCDPKTSWVTEGDELCLPLIH